MSIEELLEKNHYKGILFLISTYQDKGIRFLHLNYALVKNNGISEKTKNKIMKFFGNKLALPPFNSLFYEKLFGTGNYNVVFSLIDKSNPEPEKRIIKGDRGVTNLGNFLAKLREEELIKKDKKRFPCYRLTPKGEELFNKIYLKELVKCLNNPNTIKKVISSLQSIVAWEEYPEGF